MSWLGALISGIGRILIATYFLAEAYAAVQSRESLAISAEQLHFPWPESAFWWIVGGLGVACLLLVMGIGVRLSGALLLVYVLAHAHFQGRFWLLDPGSADRLVSQRELIKDCALAGCTMILLSEGAGLTWKSFSRRDNDREMVD